MNLEIVNIELYSDLKKIIEQARKVYVTNVNTIMLKAYWNIGKRIVEEEKMVILKRNMVLCF